MDFKKVLIIDDEQFWKMVIEKAIVRIDAMIETEFADSVAEAKSLINSGKKYDLIIADQNLSGNDSGLDLWDYLNKNELKIPFALISGNTRENFIRGLNPIRAQSIPCFIEKPSSIRELSQLIKTVYFVSKDILAISTV
jgi:DNA-binding NtrC family response regulator